jgi:hypothetical protein
MISVIRGPKRIHHGDIQGFAICDFGFAIEGKHGGHGEARPEKQIHVVTFGKQASISRSACSAVRLLQPLHPDVLVVNNAFGIVRLQCESTFSQFFPADGRGKRLLRADAVNASWSSCRRVGQCQRGTGSSYGGQ